VIHGIDTGFVVATEVDEHPDHAWAHETLARLLAAGDRLAIAPQALAEFVHVVTDQRRFKQPIPMSQALDIAEQWWNARETFRLSPGDVAVRGFLEWMRHFRLGRKRVLDTLLASTFEQEGIHSILTTNAHDFQILGEFSCISPSREDPSVAPEGA
jgi:predicted nucleic acid-binding protein